MRRKPKKPPSYREAHWGRPVRDVQFADVGEPGDNRKLIGLGALVAVVYETEKGTDRVPVHYEHKFSRKEPPLLAYGSDDGKLYIVGGEYFIHKHGIVH